MQNRTIDLKNRGKFKSNYKEALERNVVLTLVKSPSREQKHKRFSLNSGGNEQWEQRAFDAVTVPVKGVWDLQGAEERLTGDKGSRVDT